jgi:ABC-2 type transport system ATP-binding protein
MNIIECRGITKVYRNSSALNNLSCVIEENKIIGLIGRNGAGKTTLLKIIAGLIKATSGKIEVFAESPFNNLLVSANTMFIHEGMTLPPALNLKELLDVGANFYKNWNAELANRLFCYFSFHPLQYFADLSKGMKSTFLMIFGLAARCPLTLLDEPTTGMDAAVRKDIHRALLKDYIAHPRTILISSHHLNEIEDLLEEILLLHNGKEMLHMPMAEFSQWAVGLQGQRSTVEEWTANKDIIFSKSFGASSSYVVVQNTFSEKEQQKAIHAGLDFSTVTSSDLAVYLTGKAKGGIDDVFDER